MSQTSFNHSAARTSLKLTRDARGKKVAKRGYRIRYMTLRSSDSRVGGDSWERQALVVERRYFNAMGEVLMKQEGIGGNARGRMEMRPSPISPLLPQAKFLLQFPIVTLNSPAHILGDIYQLLDRCSIKKWAKMYFSGSLNEIRLDFNIFILKMMLPTTKLHHASDWSVA